LQSFRFQSIVVELGQPWLAVIVHNDDIMVDESFFCGSAAMSTPMSLATKNPQTVFQAVVSVLYRAKPKAPLDSSIGPS
jgi:fructose-specific phosphotransferase system component IIB